MPARGRRRRAVVGIAFVGIGIVVLAAAAWLGVRGWLAKGELDAAVVAGQQAQHAVASADATGASAAAAQLQRHASAALALTSDPVWRAAEVLGPVGANLAAVRVLAEQLHAVASDAIGPLAHLVGRVGPSALTPAAGRIRLQPLADAAPVVHAALESVERASDRLRILPHAGLVGPISGACDRFETALTKTACVLDGLDGTLALAPGMLGAQGARTYLLLFQNNAEVRSGGGIPSALALIHVEDGVLSLLAQADSRAFPLDAPAGLAVPAVETTLYGSLPGDYIQDVTMTPDFAESASLAARLWQQRFGGTLDGVIALDPVALGYVLAATGPVAVGDGTSLTADNAVDTLLVQSYRRFADGADQDAFFAEAARAVFDAVTSGSAAPPALLASLEKAAGENRIQLWSAHDAEQRRIAATTLGGLAASQRLAGPQAYGLYLNDATGGKMAPYLEIGVAAGATITRVDGRADVSIRVTLHNTAPADAAASLPAAVTGNGIFGVRAGKIATNLALYAPLGAFDGGVDRDGAAVAYQSVTAGDGVVDNLQVALRPGEKTVLTYRFVSALPGQRDPVLLHTPLMFPLEVGAL
ncbi:DUF4012 domain-containing protein [Rathayibacter sp. YIM 133350]|uniref:DUF4012 domain-containing protein n=1 Tax=Rathayibacter sp. YIM 133350 TaxID=3131992 RepID=UPI00307E1DD2